MADWENPLPFIIYDGEKLRVENQTASLINKIEKDLTVISIAGPYRSGKSYLMNRLMGKSSGFALGNTVESKTKGIWVWYIDHPLDPNRGLLVMDTEGLGDPMGKEDVDTFDMWILCLSILLSSTFVYNIMGVINSSVVDVLDFVTDISKHINIKANSKSDADFDGFFPHFILSIRDKCLVSEINGTTVSDDEYMEIAVLKTNKKTVSKTEKKRNETKKKLRKYFPKRKCFYFVCPTRDVQKLKKLETIQERDLNPEFLLKSEQFCSYVLRESNSKKLNHSQPITGRIFVHLTNLYLNAINNNSVPCIGSTVQLVAATENAKVLRESVQEYAKLMSTLHLPVNMEEFEQMHEISHRASIEYFMRKVFLNEGDKWHDMLQVQLQEEYVNIARKNLEASAKTCEAYLSSLYAPIRSNIGKRVYLAKGGYKEYEQALEVLQREYHSFPDKGILAEKKLQEFLTQIRNDQNMILQADLMLAECEKTLERERLLQEEAQLRADAEREKLHQLEKHKQNLIRCHQEQMKSLNETYLAKLKEEQENFTKLLESREAEQRRLLQEEWDAEAARLQNEIDNLKEQEVGIGKRIFRIVTNTGGALLSLVPNPFARVAGIGLSIIGNFFG